MTEYTINNGRTLTDEGKQQFAYELALGYFADDDLRRRFKLQPSVYATYRASDEIADLVLVKRREIDESDFALKVHARRAARIALDEYLTIVRDPEAPAKTRMEAGRQIREIASGVDKAVKDSGEGGEGPVIIKTNLSLEGAKGVYAITAAEISAQVEENTKLVAERVARDDLHDEIAALIGEDVVL